MLPDAYCWTRAPDAPTWVYVAVDNDRGGDEEAKELENAEELKEEEKDEDEGTKLKEDADEEMDVDEGEEEKGIEEEACAKASFFIWHDTLVLIFALPPMTATDWRRRSSEQLVEFGTMYTMFTSLVPFAGTCTVHWIEVSFWVHPSDVRVVSSTAPEGTGPWLMVTFSGSEAVLRRATV